VTVADSASRRGERANPAGPLAGIRVLDVCQLAVGPLVGAWLGMLGADVIKVESPYGDPIRKLPPMLNGVSTYYSAVNLNKRSIVLDLKEAADLAVVRDLVSRSDVFIQNFRPGVMERLGLGYDDLMEVNPSLVYVACSGYGSQGPRRSEGSADVFIRMFTGFDRLNGPEGGHWERLRNRGHVDHVTSSYTLEAVLAALLVRCNGGPGQLVETSMLRATMAAQLSSLHEFMVSGALPKPRGSAGRWWFPDEAFRARDGYVAISAPGSPDWQGLCDCAEIDTAAEIRNLDGAQRLGRRSELRPLIASWVSARTVSEVLEALAAHQVPAGRFTGVGALPDHVQVSSNAMVQRVPHPWGDVQVSAPPWEFEVGSVSIVRAPERDEHDAEIRAELYAAARPERVQQAAAAIAPSPPLSGIRVLEIYSRNFAVPYAGMQLRQLGADVVHVTTARAVTADQQRGEVVGTSGLPAEVLRALNRGKRCVTADLRDASDARILAGCARDAAVVLYEAGTDTEWLRELRDVPSSSIVWCEVSTFGRAGPWAGRYAPDLIVQAACGLWQYLGQPERPPLRVGVEAAEMPAGVAAVQGILAVLIQRSRTGNGDRVWVSSMQALAALESHLLAAMSRPDLTGGWHLAAPGLPPDYPAEAADTAVEFSLPDRFTYEEFFRKIGVPDDLSADERFVEKAMQVNHWTEYLNEIGPYIRRHRAEELKSLVETYGGIGVVGNTYARLLADPQVLAAGGVSVDAVSGHPTDLRPPWDFSVSRLPDDAAEPSSAWPPVSSLTFVTEG
jgi:crotonobetainyl-CoA:carnitine CoA-transferase CaiB-like acyl-CoA transferase